MRMSRGGGRDVERESREIDTGIGDRVSEDDRGGENRRGQRN